MISTLCFFKSWLYTGFATGSVEGRIAVEYFDPSPEMQDKKYAFKCHRQTAEGEDHVWPVNSLAFHPVYVVVLEKIMYRPNIILTHLIADITLSLPPALMEPSPFGITYPRSVSDSTRSTIVE